MQKLYRSLLVTGLVAVGLAGCGDDVTVTPPPPPPPPPTPQVRSVSVAPTGVTISVGGTVQMAAAVTADAGVGAVAIAWASSDAAVATVSSTGLVAGVASGSVAITATATAGGSSASGSASVTVSTTQTTPATVSIKSLLTGAGLPVPLGAAAGQINVTVNLDRGGENVQKVDLLVDGTVVGTQTFASAASSVDAAGEGEANAIEELGFGWNSAAFDAATGAVNHTNGPHTISAKVTTAENSTGTVSPTIGITLVNASFIAVTVQVLNGASANGATGILWQTGDIQATAVPVLYAGGTIQQIVLTPTALASKTLTAAPFVATWAKGTSVGGGGAGSSSTGIEVLGLVVGAVSTVNGAVGPVGGSAAINFDTKAPGAPTFVANPNARQNGWLNAGVGLAGLNTSATDNDWLANGAADAGVGGYIRIVRIGNGPTAAAANAAAGETSPTLPAPSLTNVFYCAVVSAKDNLDNESALPAGGTTCSTPPVASFTAVAAQHLAFGVDIAVPTIAFSGGLASNSVGSGATVGAEFQVTVADVGTVGNSGMLTGSSVIGTVQIRNATGNVCFIGAGGGCANVSINPAPVFPLVPTLTVAASTTVGYYTAVLIGVDAAGNQTAAITRVTAYDAAANVPALTTALFNTPLNGPSVVFNANASDNFDLANVVYTMTYSGAFAGLVGPIQFPAVVLNTYNVAPLVNSNVPAGLTVNGFMRQVEDVVSNSPLFVGAAGAGGTQNPASSVPDIPTGIAGTVTDIVGNAFGPVATPIPGGSVTAGVSYLAAAATQLIDSWAVTNGATSVSTGVGTPVNPTSVTLVAKAAGPTATFNPPFTRVDFYAVAGGNLVQVGSATAVNNTVDNGAPQGRVHTYQVSWTPGTAFGTGVQAVYAIGVNAAGDALITVASGAITITQP